MKDFNSRWAEVQASMQPPRNIDRYTACADNWPYEIRELGDQIANLKLAEAVRLGNYLKSLGIKFLQYDGISL